MVMRVLVAGGTGVIGRRLVPQLGARGDAGGRAGVGGGRDRGPRKAAGAAARGPGAPGYGYDDEPGQVGLTGAAGRRWRRDGRAGCNVRGGGGGRGAGRAGEG